MAFVDAILVYSELFAFTDFFRRSVPDNTLSKLLHNAIHDDSEYTFTLKLKEYIVDRDNYRSIVKCGLNLWEALGQLLLTEG